MRGFNPTYSMPPSTDQPCAGLRLGRKIIPPQNRAQAGKSAPLLNHVSICAVYRLMTKSVTTPFPCPHSRLPAPESLFPSFFCFTEVTFTRTLLQFRCL